MALGMKMFVRGTCNGRMNGQEYQRKQSWSIVRYCCSTCLWARRVSEGGVWLVFPQWFNVYS